MIEKCRDKFGETLPSSLITSRLPQLARQLEGCIQLVLTISYKKCNLIYVGNSKSTPSLLLNNAA